MPDGRIVWVRGYKLPQSAIDSAYKIGHMGLWISLVKADQTRKRLINEAKAAALNSYRLGIDPPYFHKVGVSRATQAVEGQ
jgi:hypothetical protein